MILACSAVVLHAEESTSSTQGNQEAVDVGNTKCPVSGRSMNGQSSYTYNGRKYNLCGDQCKKDFATNPDKYAKIGDEEAASKQD